MPDWLQSTLQASPLFLMVALILGLPSALIVLPRRDWSDRPVLVALSLLFGPALMTAWMFILGTLGQNDDPNAAQTDNPMQTILRFHTGGENLLRPDLILAGLAAIALLLWLLVFWRTRQSSPDEKTPSVPLYADEKLIIGFIVLATLARWVISSWLPFGSWDPLWVYGYQAKIYTLIGYIPADIGYYPQFLPLQYAFGQIMTGDLVNDHAARAIMPFLQVGSIFAVYVLAARLVNRRAGIFAAGLWALYPHFGYWTRVGDLEIPVTFGFTMASAFFLMAWTQSDQVLRRHYAIIAGLCFGVAMWTKPTAGAFIYGVVLLVMLEFLRVRGDWRAWLPRFEVAFLTGLACIPLGGLWYARNILLGHDAIVLPPPFWLTQAMRSGTEFGWPLLALALLLLFLYLGPPSTRPKRLPVLIGVLLLAIALSPTILEPRRMIWWEWLVFVAGVGAVLWALLPYARTNLTPEAQRILTRVFWALLLVVPYFITWFYSYSYHYRLSFAIVPLMILPSAAILAYWFNPARIARWKLPLRLAYAALIVLLALPGTAIAIYDEGLGWDWLWTIPPEDDFSKAGLLGVVEVLRDAQAEDHELIVMAPGLQPLPFFFPEAEIYVTRTPRDFEQLGQATYFINSDIGLLRYEFDGEVSPFQNQWLASLPRDNVATRIASFQDISFFFEVYELHPEQRFEQPPAEVVPEAEIVFGDFARLVGYNLSATRFDAPVQLELVWQALGPAAEDYTLLVHFIDEDEPDRLWSGWDGPVRYWDLNYYSTLFWETGEYIIDRRTLALQQPDIPAGDDYRIRIGFYHPVTFERVPVYVNGEAAGDTILLQTRFSVPASESGD